MKRVYVLSVVLLSILLLSASEKVDITKTSNMLVNKQSQNFITVVDYNKIKKGATSFHFFPVYFYISTDGCNNMVEKIKREEVVNIDICTGFNVIDDFHHLRFEIITPDSAVYQNVNLFIDNPKNPPKIVKFGEDYTPYNITKPFYLFNVDFIRSSLPVAGSAIQTQNLVGKWRIDLYIDDSIQTYGEIYFEVE